MKKNLEIMVTFLILPGIFLAGCARVQRATDESSELEARGEHPLLNQEWVLKSLGPIGSEESSGTDTEITLEFGEDGRLHGSAGCNRYFAGYELGTGNSLSIGNTGSTMMMCPDEVMNREFRYLQALENVSSYSIEKNRLLLSLDEEQEVLRFVHENPTLPSETTNEKEPAVESFRSLPFVSFNERLDDAAGRDESWVYDPIRVALEFTNSRGASVVSIKRKDEGREKADSTTVTIVEDGYQDDSIRGMWTRFKMIRLGDNTWRVADVHQAYRCHRGQQQENYSAQTCP